MKVQLNKDEWYPFYTDTLGFGDLVEVPDELWFAYKKAVSDFTAMHNALKAYLEEKDICV